MVALTTFGKTERAAHCSDDSYLTFDPNILIRDPTTQTTEMGNRVNEAPRLLSASTAENCLYTVIGKHRGENKCFEMQETLALLEFTV